MTRKTPLIPRAELFADADYFNPTISPDGRLIAYLKRDDGGLKFFVRTVGKSDDRAVSANVRMNWAASKWQWQQDNQHILYMADTNGDENYHIYTLDVSTGVAKDLTPFDRSTSWILNHSAAHPNALLFTSNRRDKTIFDAYKLDLSSGQLDMIAENPGDVDSGLNGLSWVPDSMQNIRAALAVLPDGSKELRVRDKVSDPWRVLVATEADDMIVVLGFTTDDTGLLVLTSKESNTKRLIRLNLDTAKVRVLAQDKKYDFGDFMTGPLFCPKTGELQGINQVRDRTHWRFFDTRIRAQFRTLEKLHPQAELRIISRDSNDQTWTLSYTFDNAPVRYYSYDRRSEKVDFLFSGSEQLARYKLAKMRCIKFKSRDGLDIHGYLVLPRGVKHRQLPLVINVHGGPWSRNRWMLDMSAQWLADRGYAVLFLNFRGSTGYGKAFVNAGDREWGAKMHDDIIDAKRWAVEQGVADPDRVAIYGASYGGYAALVGVTFTPDEFACAIDVVGPSDLVTLLGTIPPYWKASRAMFDRRVGNWETEVDFLGSRSPVHKVYRIKAPLLIGQGANDPRVIQAESDQMVEVMRWCGMDVEYVLFPDEGHGFHRSVNKQKFFAAMERFLAEHLGGACEPATTRDDWRGLLR